MIGLGWANLWCTGCNAQQAVPGSQVGMEEPLKALPRVSGKSFPRQVLVRGERTSLRQAIGVSTAGGVQLNCTKFPKQRKGQALSFTLTGSSPTPPTSQRGSGPCNAARWRRFQFSSVERRSPKPDAVGSNPTERDSVPIKSNPLNYREFIPTGTSNGI